MKLKKRKNMKPITKKAVAYYNTLKEQGVVGGLNGMIVCVMNGIAFMVRESEIDQRGEYFKMIENNSGIVNAINLFE